MTFTHQDGVAQTTKRMHTHTALSGIGYTSFVEPGTGWGYLIAPYATRTWPCIFRDLSEETSAYVPTFVSILWRELISCRYCPARFLAVAFDACGLKTSPTNHCFARDWIS